MQKFSAHGFATKTANASAMHVEVRQPRATDVQLDVVFSGICHSDLHTVRDEWGGTTYPCVPGHEIIGRVTKVGADAAKEFKVGDVVAVGCMVGSCQHCKSCKHDEEQFCKKCIFTYNGKNADGTITYGGYTSSMVVDHNFVIHVPAALHKNLAATAPLLCAGITTFSPLMRFGVKPTSRVAVAGLGGLGHMGVKFARAFGSHVTVLSTSASKKDDAMKLGANAFLVTTDKEAMKAAAESFDFILNTISAKFNFGEYMSLLDIGGTMCIVGAPPPNELANMSLIFGRKQIVGSLIGGVAETEQMLKFCADHQIYSEIELIKSSDIDKAYERMLKSDVKYRFVIQGDTLGK